MLLEYEVFIADLPLKGNRILSLEEREGKSGRKQMSFWRGGEREHLLGRSLGSPDT